MLRCVWDSNFSQTLSGTTGASFCRIKLERGSKCQKKSILFIYNEIKDFWNFWSARRISNLPSKNLILMTFEYSLMIFCGNDWPKKFCCAHGKVCILQTKLYNWTQINPEGPQKFFYCVMTCFIIDLENNLGGVHNMYPPQRFQMPIPRCFSWRAQELLSRPWGESPVKLTNPH